MSIFNDGTVQVYNGNWEVSETRKLAADEIAAVKSARVVDSQYGASVCFMLAGGRKAFIPLSRDSHAQVGDSVDVTKMSLVTLSREGDDDIVRAEI